MKTNKARKATAKAPIAPELAYLAEISKPPTPAEMVEMLEEDADGWISSNTFPVGDIGSLEIDCLRSVMILRAAAEFIRSRSRP